MTREIALGDLGMTRKARPPQLVGGQIGIDAAEMIRSRILSEYARRASDHTRYLSVCSIYFTSNGESSPRLKAISALVLL